MISDFVTEWYYWLTLLSLTVCGCWILSARLFDFQFFIILILSQYATHTAITFGLANKITIFCILFLILFVFFARGKCNPVNESRQSILTKLRPIHFRWMQVSKWYLLIYYLARLFSYPFLSGELLLDARLSAQQENPLIFVLGLAVQPALAACIFSWITQSEKISIFDKGIILIVTLGMFGAGSKSAVIPMLLVYIGVASYLNRNIFENKAVLFALFAVIALTVYALITFFPGLKLSDIAQLVQYRVAANTDSIEYIFATGVDPNLYPFSGIGSLMPMIARRFGYAFEFPPGVWLHGVRFGDWSGFGPNAGIVMDYFGNLGWFGLIAAILLGLYVKRTRQLINPISCSFLSMIYISVVDIGIFDISLVVWGGILFLLFAIRKIRLPKLQIFIRSGYGGTKRGELVRHFAGQIGTVK